MLPRRTLTVLRAESLVNDGTALVIYSLAVGITAGQDHFSALHIGSLFLRAYGGGAAAGAVTAWLAVQMRRRLDDPLLENVAILLIPFTAFLPAEAIGASGVLAVVVCGLAVDPRRPGFDRCLDPEQDRSRAIGTWAGLSGVASALGPFVGGWLVDTASWRWVFFINVPLAALAVVITVPHVPESRDTTATGRLDLAGAASVTVGLGGIIYALVEVPVHGWTPLTVTAVTVGVLALAAFPLIERRQPAPLIPLSLFGSAQFTGANLVTLKKEMHVAAAADRQEPYPRMPSSPTFSRSGTEGCGPGGHAAAGWVQLARADTTL